MSTHFCTTEMKKGTGWRSVIVEQRRLHPKYSRRESSAKKILENQIPWMVFKCDWGKMRFLEVSKWLLAHFIEHLVAYSLKPELGQLQIGSR